MSDSQSRLEKLEKLDDPYPRDFPGRETIASILFQYNSNIYAKEKIVPSLDPSKPVYKIAGRISARRDHRDNIFFDIFDQTGSIQIHAKLICAYCNENKASINNEICPECCGNKVTWPSVEECDIGDMVGAEGTLDQNPRGETLLLISNFTLLAKALKDPPANFHGVKNPEHKYRHREQDLMSSAESREVFKKRAEIVFEIRKYLNERDFIEIETPILQPIYGGATARPFVTQHNALSQQFYLAISSELYLKRALVGGFDRVYAFSRCFRNEGISPEHNPEFTNLEIFETCKTSQDMEKFVIDLWDYLYKIFNLKDLPWNFQFMRNLPSQDWPLSRKYSPIAINDLIARQQELKEQTGKGGSSLIDKTEFADAWELFAGDMEIASGASDLNDPREQEKRLKESELSTLKQDDTGVMYTDKAMDYDPYDQNYIEALEMGALPWAGVGIGIDRLCMLLLGKKNIRDVITFPTLRQI